MPSSNDIRAGAAYVELGIKGDFSKQLDAAAKRLKSFGDSITNIGRSVGAVGASILAPLLGAATAYGAMGKELEIASQKTGIAVEALSELKYAAEQSGASFDDLTTGIRKMQRSLIEAANNSPPAVAALRSLHLTIQQLRGLSPEQQFQLIADRLGSIQSASLRTATAMAIFGRGGAQLIPMMRQIEELTARARDLGIVMSTEDAQAATKFANTMRDVYDQAKFVTFQIGAAVAQGLQPFASSLRSVLPQLIEFTRENKGMIQAALALGIGLTAVGGTLVVFGQSIRLIGSSWLAVSGLFRIGGALIRSAIALPVSAAVGSFKLLTGAAGLAGTVITAAIGATGAVITGIGTAIAFVLSPLGLLVVGIAAAVAAAIYFSGVGGAAMRAVGSAASSTSGLIKSTFGSAFSNVAAVFAELKSTALETFHGIADAMSAGDISLAAKILWTGIRLAWIEGTQGIRNTWSNFMAYFGGVWESVVGVMLDVWHTISDAVSKTINEIHQAYSFVTGGTYTAGSDNAKINADRDKSDQDRTTKEINDQSKRYDDASSEAARLKDEKASLQTQLDTQRTKAANEKASTDAKAKTDADKQKDEDNAGDSTPQTQPSVRSPSGIFNIAGVAGLTLPGSSQQDRIATATEQTAKNTATMARTDPTSNKKYMDDLHRQNATDTGAAMRTELNDVKKNIDGTYTSRSRATGITATLTQDQINTLRAKIASSPILPVGQLQQQAQDAMRRHESLMQSSPSRKGGKDDHGPELIRKMGEGNIFLKKIADAMPSLAFQ